MHSMSDKEKKNKDQGIPFGTPTVSTLKGHYKPLSEFDQKVIALIVKNFAFFAEANKSEVKSVNKVHLKPSYSQVATLLNEEGQATKRGKKWDGTTVRRLIEKTEGDDNIEIGHGECNWENSCTKRRREFDEFAIMMRDEILPSIDSKQKHHRIANDLNERGITTRKGGKWGNVAVGRLLKRIKKLPE